MAIRNIQSSNEMSVEEFKEWLKKFDDNGDGRISKEELCRAIRSTGKRFSGLKSGRALRQADSDRNGIIDDGEIANLVAFAQKSLGMKIAPY